MAEKNQRQTGTAGGSQGQAGTTTLEPESHQTQAAAGSPQAGGSQSGSTGTRGGATRSTSGEQEIVGVQPAAPLR